jgi:Rps23 Pro-64 3,4-dihydroxylase Tpa1-like proline 4-hydroxylase
METKGMSVLFDAEYLAKLQLLAKDSAAEYKANKPFPHIYFDNFLPVEAAEAALRDFPQPKQLNWNAFAGQNEKKLAFDLAEKLPDSIRDVLYFLNSRPMVEFLEVLTGIDGVIPDPYFVGGGLHQIERGGHLEVHADFNHHKKLNLDRRLNVLVYMNKDWKEEYGGHFELWNHDMTAAEKKILPLFNRCAIFSTTDFSYHGHPTPLACPPDRSRKSMATYYYSNGRPEEEKSDSHSTLFKARPGDVKLPEPGEAKSSAVKSVLRAITPPIIVDTYKHLRK